MVLAAMLMLSILAVGALPATAADDDHLLARKLRQSGEILSLETIIERVRREKPGEILEIELERQRGRFVYEIELIDQAGQVWELKLDAKTGDVINMKLDD